MASFYSGKNQGTEKQSAPCFTTAESFPVSRVLPLVWLSATIHSVCSVGIPQVAPICVDISLGRLGSSVAPTFPPHTPKLPLSTASPCRFVLRRAADGTHGPQSSLCSGMRPSSGLPPCPVLLAQGLFLGFATTLRSVSPPPPPPFLDMSSVYCSGLRHGSRRTDECGGCICPLPH